MSIFDSFFFLKITILIAYYMEKALMKFYRIIIYVHVIEFEFKYKFLCYFLSFRFETRKSSLIF